MTDFNFYDDAPPMPAHDPAPVPAVRNNTEIRAQNGNIGAVIVAVPRNLGVVRQRISEAANFNGHNWEYRLPFKTKNNDGEFVPVTGPTVKCALDIARAYGNCNVEIDGDIRETPEAWYFNASITDLESGSRLVRPFRQRKNQNVGGKMDADRQLDMIFQIGVSKAERNVIVNFLPGLVDEALDMAKRSVIGKIEANPKKWIGGIRDWLAQSDISEERLSRHYNRSLDDMMPAQIADIVQSILAVKEGRASKSEFYADSTQDGTVVDMPADKAKPEATTDRATAEKVDVAWRGKPLTKTRFIRDVRHSIKAAANADELGAVSDQIDAAQESAKGEAPKMWAEIAEALEAAWLKFPKDEKKPDHDPKTGEVIEPGTDQGPPINLFDE